MENSQTGCEKWGAMCYPRCNSGFYAFGCCICSPECINGQTDIGVSCAKKTYGRGAGSSMHCRNGLEQNGLLCYEPCRDNSYSGVGPVCWAGCPAGYTNCGALCTEINSDCSQYLADKTSNLVSVAIGVSSQDYITAAMSGLEAVMGLDLPICS